MLNERLGFFFVQTIQFRMKTLTRAEEKGLQILGDEKEAFVKDLLPVNFLIQ